MIDLPGADPAMTARWSGLVGELDCWAEAGRTANLWWRDDDAVAATPRLERLLAIAEDVPIGLAVIPAAAEPALAARLALAPRLAVLQHGWRHANRAASGKKSEFPASRPQAAVAADLAAGQARLAALFGPRALPVLVPPWNRLDPVFLPVLASSGIAALSCIKPRGTAAPAAGIGQVNVHVDLVAWKGDRGFVGVEPALGGLVGHLRARRLGRVDAAEPTGLLTHHLVMDEAATDFLYRLVALIRAHAAARWVAPAELFARP